MYFLKLSSWIIIVLLFLLFVKFTTHSLIYPSPYSPSPFSYCHSRASGNPGTPAPLDPRLVGGKKRKRGCAPLELPRVSHRGVRQREGASAPSQKPSPFLS